MKTTTNSIGDTTWAMEKLTARGAAVIEFTARLDAPGAIEIVRKIVGDVAERAVTGLAVRHGAVSVLSADAARVEWLEARAAGYR